MRSGRPMKHLKVAQRTIGSWYIRGEKDAWSIVGGSEKKQKKEEGRRKKNVGRNRQYVKNRWGAERVLHKLIKAVLVPLVSRYNWAISLESSSTSQFPTFSRAYIALLCTLTYRPASVHREGTSRVGSDLVWRHPLPVLSKGISTVDLRLRRRHILGKGHSGAEYSMSRV